MQSSKLSYPDYFAKAPVNLLGKTVVKSDTLANQVAGNFYARVGQKFPVRVQHAEHAFRSENLGGVISDQKWSQPRRQK